MVRAVVVEVGGVAVVLPARVVGRRGPRSMRRVAAEAAEQEIGRGDMLMLELRSPGTEVRGIDVLREPPVAMVNCKYRRSMGFAGPRGS
jgi:hypothetical protein